MQNPLTHIDIDTKPFESAMETAFEVVTDTFSDVTDTLGEHFTDDVIPMAKAGAQRTQTFVRTRTRVSIATVAGLALVIGLVVMLKRRRRSDEAVERAADRREGPRSVA
jgi:LPXTG-motif cell wall-anchored protein